LFVTTAVTCLLCELTLQKNRAPRVKLCFEMALQAQGRLSCSTVARLQRKQKHYAQMTNALPMQL
jgi:hypothetical protein